jgi:hypothetical protein
MRVVAAAVAAIACVGLTMPFGAQARPIGPDGPAGPPTLAGCPMFPADNVWNWPVDELPVHPLSRTYVETIGAARPVHPDFGSGLWNGGPIGIPFVVVPGTQPKVPVTFEYADESDPGPYPIPRDAPIEGGAQSNGDRHILVVDKDNCVLYETWSTYPNADGSWRAGSGAKFDLRSNALRPDTWTSSDAAGLPVLHGLVRYDEVAAGEISHAIRFTVPQTQRKYIWPARHYASNLVDARYPPMGLRMRLRAGFDDSGLSPDTRVITRALKKYGMILADNGSAWFISGVPDERWNNDHLRELARITGADFEAVDTSILMADPDSGRVAGAIVPSSTPTAPAPTPTPPAATATVLVPTATPTGGSVVPTSTPTATAAATDLPVPTPEHTRPTPPPPPPCRLYLPRAERGRRAP